jgi:hypothetical protein
VTLRGKYEWYVLGRQVIRFSPTVTLYTINFQKSSLLKKAVPLQAWTGPQGSRRLGSQISRQSAHEGGEVVSLRHRPPLAAGNTPGTHFC